jgi:chromosomal replication initiator protein
VDVLILDDVQFLAGKEQTQEELFHTFNTLHSSGKQIVLTSDKPPAAIAGLEPRLRSRFEGGLIADIHPPTREMRLAIVHAKAAGQGVELPKDVAELLATRSGRSVRELEGALTRVVAEATVRRTPITVALAEQAIGPFRGAPRVVSVEHIQSAVGAHFQVSVEDLVSHQRGRRVMLPRQIAMYLSRTVASESYPSIAEKFGGRDHATVMHAVRVIEEKRLADSTLNRLVSTLEGEVRAE